MAIVIDPGAGALSQAIGNLGRGIASKVFEKRNREDALRRDPLALQQLIPTMEVAVGEGPETVAALAKTLNVNESFILDAAQGFAPTAVQRIQDVQAETAERTNAADIAEGLTEVEAAARASRARVDHEFTEQLLEGDITSLQIEALRNQTEFEIDNFAYQRGLLTIRRESGIDEVTINAEAVTAAIGAEASQRFIEYVNSLPLDSDERVVALAGLSGSGAAGALASMRNADLASAVREAALRQTTEENAIALGWELQDRLNAAVDRLAEAEESGRDKDFIEQAKADVDNASLLSQHLIELGRVPGFAIPTVGGKVGKIKLDLSDVSSDRVRDVLQQARNAFIGEDLDGEEKLSEEEVRRRIPGLISGFSPRERREFEDKLNLVFTPLPEESVPGTVRPSTILPGQRSIFGQREGLTFSIMDLITKLEKFLATPVVRPGVR
jgi:hypothetical protein